jgi:hypothetical protein
MASGWCVRSDGTEVVYCTHCGLLNPVAENADFEHPGRCWACVKRCRRGGSHDRRRLVRTDRRGKSAR